MRLTAVVLAFAFVTPAVAAPTPFDRHAPPDMGGITDGVWPVAPKRYKVKRAKAKKPIRAVRHKQRPSIKKSVAIPHSSIPLPKPRLGEHPMAHLAIGNQPVDIEVEPVSESVAEIVRIPFNIFKAFADYMVRPVGNCREFETLDPRLKTIANDAARRFQRPALATSCYRSPAHNRAVRGARRSQHMARKAIDFKIPGVGKYELAKFVRGHPLMKKIGGVGVYKSDFIHADVGPKRNWDWNRREKRVRYAGGD